MNSVLFSSKTDLWETPKSLFDSLDAVFHFDFDLCALPENAKCPLYYTPDQDSLLQDWSIPHTYWCNPPYGRDIHLWIKKAFACGRTVVMLLPARVDTSWFHDFIYNNPHCDYFFLRGRLKFGDSKNSAPFPSMIVVFHGF